MPTPTWQEIRDMAAANPLPGTVLTAQENDLLLIRQATLIIREAFGSLRARPMVMGVNDGSVAERDYTMPMNEEPREEVLADHVNGKHKVPQLDCPRCQSRYAQFRRRRDARMDVVVALGGHCRLCGEGVPYMAAKFVHRRGAKCLLTQMFQWKHEELVAEAKANYAMICPRCSKYDGRRKVVALEKSAIAIGIAPRGGNRADKGTKKGKR